jgi:hypothetical protein
MTLDYSKKLRMHKPSMSLTIGIYNLVRKHNGLDGQTPAQAAGVEMDRWALVVERVVTMTEAYWDAKNAEQAKAKRAQDDAAFGEGFRQAGL